MGSGRGDYKDLIAPVKPGDIICEVRTVTPLSLRQITNQLRVTLPFEVRIVERDYNRPHMKVKKSCPTMETTFRRYQSRLPYSKRIEFMRRVNIVLRKRQVDPRNLINLIDP